MLLVATQPVFAALVGGDPNAPAPTPTPAQPPAQAPVPAATPPAPAEPSKPTQTIQGVTIPKDLSKLTPAESKKLLEQAKNLNPEQLQAIAKSYQQGQEQQAKDQAPEQPAIPSQPLSPERKKSLQEMQRDQAFGSLIDDVLPMSPDQIVKIRKYYDLTLQAKAMPANPSPTPAIRSETVSTEPGSDIPVIRLSAGFVTSVLFTDANCGSPWKLRSYSIGDPGTFNIQWDHKGNTIFIQSMKPYAHGNLAIQLWGLDTPIMLTLVSGPRMLDSRVDFKVPGRNPDCEAPPIISGGISSVANVNSMLINILDGVPPRGSIKLHVAGGPGEAWLVDNKIFFRTKLTLLSPAWVSSVSSPDGTHVYELMLTPSILASENGKTIDIKLSGL